MSLRPLASILLLAASTAWAAKPSPGGVITHKPVKHLSDGRATVTRAAVAPKKDDFVLTLDFDRAPAVADCKATCARSTFLIDTDADPSTGLQQGSGRPTTGADLAIFVEGFDDFGSVKPEPYVRVTVRQFTDSDRTLEDGDVVQTLDQRRDKERVSMKGNTATIKIDASSTTIPAAKTCKFVYLVPSVKPLTTGCVGITRETPGGGKVSIHRGAPSYGSGGGSGSRSARAKNPGGGSELPPSVKPGDIEIKQGGSAYDPSKIDKRWGEGG